MFETKNLDFGFMVMCPDMSLIALQNTLKSIKRSHPNCPVIAVVPTCIKPEILKEMKKVCSVYKGKDTITSLMNTALRNLPTDWGIFVMAGTWVNIRIADKFSRFIQDDSDILFPIEDNIYVFKNCTLNGLCLNKKVFKKVGPFAEKGAIDKCKEEWSLYAYGMCGSKFKAILGAAL